MEIVSRICDKSLTAEVYVIIIILPFFFFFSLTRMASQYLIFAKLDITESTRVAGTSYVGVLSHPTDYDNALDCGVKIDYV